jgi:membrane dipeptidase
MNDRLTNSALADEFEYEVETDMKKPNIELLYIALLIVFVSMQVHAGEVAADRRVSEIHKDYVFADMHSHPSRFHRKNIESISVEEIEVYRRSTMDLVVANISSDMAYDGEYVNRDGTEVKKGKYKPEPGEVYALSSDRLLRLRKTFELGYAVHASAPSDVIEARKNNQVAIMPALEGADALEGDIENLFRLHDDGLRLLQLVHFRNNELGHNQTWPYSPGGLTEFGREVVRESNRLGIVIDLAHANNETLMDTLALSRHPIIFSHGGVREFTDHDRAVTDKQIRAIARKGGVIGIWPHGRHLSTVAEMVDYMEHVVKIGGIDHVGIGSDLRGISRYVEGFGEEAQFHAIALEFLKRGYSDEDVGKVMGGNFYRVWLEVSDAR